MAAPLRHPHPEGSSARRASIVLGLSRQAQKLAEQLSAPLAPPSGRLKFSRSWRRWATARPLWSPYTRLAPGPYRWTADPALW
jgi:hypothetical protein